DRLTETLGRSDKGLILYRRLLRENLEKVARGEDPMNVFRDPAAARYVKLQTEESSGIRKRQTTLRQISSAGAGGGATKFSPVLARGSATPVTAEEVLKV
ncbi:MAG: hypothetical protein AAB289_01110, partial [Chloroflexota bacterium]